ncbi:MAG TPA: hypothetical protein VEA35_00610 [Ramlibacter sp.]|nr:hypothetical protein [Ramlibacter sp.]
MPIGARSLKRKVRVKESTFIRSVSHKMFIRQQRCILWGRPGHECKGPVQCCHYRMATGGGMGLKPSDEFTFPCCWGGHDLQHKIGEVEFQERFGLDLREVCKRFARRSTDPRVREAVNDAA